MFWFLLLIGLLSGWLAGITSRNGGFGIWGDPVAGVVGSFIGGFLFNFMGISQYGTLGLIISSIVGAFVLLVAIRMFRVAAPAHKKK